MITLLHGENIVASRDKLVELITQAKNRNKTIDRLDAKKLTPGFLQTKLIKQDLFGTERVIVIEDLLSLPRSKQKSALIDLVASCQADVILWGKRDLTKTMLKRFNQAKIHHFKLSKNLFTWLDSLRGDSQNTSEQIKLLHQALNTEDAYLCFIMLARQIRMLIQALDNQLSGPPWMVKKIQHQAQSFQLNQLLQIHSQLLEIDHRHKTSSNTLELDQELDLLLLNL